MSKEAGSCQVMHVPKSACKAVLGILSSLILSLHWGVDVTFPGHSVFPLGSDLSALKIPHR